MYPILKDDRNNISGILSATHKLATKYFDRQTEIAPSLEVNNLPYPGLPLAGIGAYGVLDFFQKHVADQMANSAGPRYFGFVTGGATPAAVAGDWLVSAYDQVMSGSNDSVAHAIERQTIQFMLELFSLGDQFTGTFVTGATMANFVSLATGRQWIGEQHGRDMSEEGIDGISVKVLSATPHSSILKSLSMLGLGRRAWHPVPTMPGREAIDVAALESTLREIGEPVIVVANAGTVNTVDFDDLDAIASLKKKYTFFLHVDAAFGGFAATSPRYRKNVEGIQLADTVTIDAHKWLNVPYDAAMQFTRHRSLQVNVFRNNAAYLGNPDANPDSMHLTPENSRRFRALPAWFSIMAYGSKGYREVVERNCEAASLLGELIESSDAFRLLAKVNMNVVCFSFKKETTADHIRNFLTEVRKDGRVFFTPTIYNGVPAIRAAISNWQTSTSDIMLAFDVLKEFSEKHAEFNASEAISND
jgi:glutamate/tyrosine decarboxylase-like PLP-dependent enzyme